MVRGNAISVVAIVLIAIGVTSAAYIRFQEEEAAEGILGIHIEIGDLDANMYDLDELFNNFESETIETSRGSYEGVALENVVDLMNIEAPEECNYTIFASDGYNKTVTWTNITNGILTDYPRVVFSDLGKRYWVKNVTLIKMENRSLVVSDTLVETINVDGENYDGVSLKILMDEIGVEDPSRYMYTFIASDGYQKTLEWKNVKVGIISMDKGIIIPGLDHHFWVKNVVEIRGET